MSKTTRTVLNVGAMALSAFLLASCGGHGDEKKDEKKAEATPTPKPEKKVRTPYAGNYTKQSLSYESSSKAISFETTTLDGSSTGSSLFSKNRITMVNIWTRT